MSMISKPLRSPFKIKSLSGSSLSSSSQAARHNPPAGLACVFSFLSGYGTWPSAAGDS